MKKQKHKSERKNMSPFWWTKKGELFYPLPPIWTNVPFSAIFFLEGIPKYIPDWIISVLSLSLDFLSFFHVLVTSNLIFMDGGTLNDSKAKCLQKYYKNVLKYTGNALIQISKHNFLWDKILSCSPWFLNRW